MFVKKQRKFFDGLMNYETCFFQRGVEKKILGYFP